MPEAAIDKHTCWECQRCGKCCIDIVMHKGKSLSVEKEGKMVCKFFNEETKLCNSYEQRPFICRIYPFVADMAAIVGPDKIARPQRAFLIANMKIHTECPGYGNGKRIYANKNLLKKIDKLALEFAENYKKYINKDIGLMDII